MSWATHYIAELLEGKTVEFRPRGNSMTGRISSGQLCTVEPADRDPVKNDIVLCKVRGAQYLHIVSAVRGDQFQISNNHGHINGWTTRKNIYGILSKVI
jgi:phage repressor protein C with HTH and peptisase S24 domain